DVRRLLARVTGSAGEPRGRGYRRPLEVGRSRERLRHTRCGERASVEAPERMRGSKTGKDTALGMVDGRDQRVCFVELSVVHGRHSLSRTRFTDLIRARPTISG